MGRDGIASAPGLSGRWPQKLALAWERQVGEGYSGPIVAGGRVWVHSRRGEKEVVSCLLLSTGDTLWSQSYDAPFRQDDDALSHGRGPYSTPCISDGRLFTFGVNSVLSAWDAESGRLLWRRESGKEFDPAFPYFGEAGSPLVWDQLCFVHLGGHHREGAARPDTGAVVALQVANGSEKWRWSGDAPAAGASPLICEIEGQSQLVYKTKQNIVGFDPNTGNQLWRMPYKVPMDNTIVTPLVVQGRLITSDYDAGISAWRIQRSGNSWATHQLWHHREVSLFTSSPVFVGGMVVGFSHFRKGHVFVLNPINGEVVWRGEPRSGEHASIIAWGSEALVFLEDGSLLVGTVTADWFRLVRRYSLGNSGGWAHPALAAGHIIVKDGNRLAAYRLSGR
jgi:outer membrane protein assembly factor BamB